MKKVMARFNLLFLLSALVAQNGITDTPINTFDSNLPDNYFEFSTSDNNNPEYGFINHSIVDNPANQGTGALQIEYGVHNIESWGGYTAIDHSAEEGTVWDWSGNDAIVFDFYNLVPANFSGNNDAQLRFNFEDAFDLNQKEYFYSFHDILNLEPGWNTIEIPLVNNYSFSGDGFNLTGWVGFLNNENIDLDAISRYTIEFSITGSGQGDYVNGTIILDNLRLRSYEQTYVPDDNFEQALIDQGYDDVLDDYVLTSNISSVDGLEINILGISDLTGIEDFSALENLGAYGNQLTSVDLSNNTALRVLELSDNQLTSLDISNNLALEELLLQNNPMTTLDVTSNINLTHLNVMSNSLTGLDVTNNVNLTHLFLGGGTAKFQILT